MEEERDQHDDCYGESGDHAESDVCGDGVAGSTAD
jgi:hypothetical protein